MILSDPTSQVLSFFADKNPTSCVNILLVFRSYRVIRVSAHAHGFCPGAQVQPEAPYFESSAPIFPSALSLRGNLCTGGGEGNLEAPPVL